MLDGIAAFNGVRVCSPVALYLAAFCGLKALKRRLLRSQADVRIVLQHPPRQVPRDRFHDMVRLASFQQSRDDSVPQVMEPEARQARGVA